MTSINLRAIAVAAAQRAGIDPQIFLRQIQQESGFNPNARSSAGAEGIAQFMPATAAGFHINPYDPVQALQAAAKMDAGNLKKYGSYAQMLSAYNSGRANAYKDPNFAGGQTYRYVNDILKGSNFSPGPLTTPPSTDGKGGLGPIRPPQGNAAAALAMLAQSMQTGDSGDGGLLALALQRLQSGAAQSTYGPQGATGSLVKPLPQPVNLAASGPVSFMGSIAGEKPGFLKALEAAVSAAGATKVRVISGYRSPQHNAAVGGAQGSLHMQGAAMDGEAYVPGKGWIPLGQLLRSNANKYGLRSGDQSNFFRGTTDPNHVDFAPSL